MHPPSSLAELLPRADWIVISCPLTNETRNLLNADAFKRRPMVKRRILRVFNNVNPFGAPRLWKVGGDFTEYAKRYVNKIRQPYPGEFAILNMLRLTHWKRSHYDHIMLNLHDMGKQNRNFQENSPQQQFAFPPNSVWMCFTDGVLHAALAGRYALERYEFSRVQPALMK